MKLIRALRRFFAPGAAEEIWAFFRPKLLTMHPDFQEASTIQLESWRDSESDVDRACIGASEPSDPYLLLRVTSQQQPNIWLTGLHLLAR